MRVNFTVRQRQEPWRIMVEAVLDMMVVWWLVSGHVVGGSALVYGW